MAPLDFSVVPQIKHVLLLLDFALNDESVINGNH